MTRGDLSLQIRILDLTGFLLVLFGAACGRNSSAVDLKVEDPGILIGDDADPVIISKLPISTRSFEMGTAGFVPRHYPSSLSELSILDFMLHYSTPEKFPNLGNISYNQSR